jgi:hypothetical protein
MKLAQMSIEKLREALAIHNTDRDAAIARGDITAFYKHKALAKEVRTEIKARK